jgi:hypothetical protein
MVNGDKPFVPETEETKEKQRMILEAGLEAERGKVPKGTRLIRSRTISRIEREARLRDARRKLQKIKAEQQEKEKLEKIKREEEAEARIIREEAEKKVLIVSTKEDIEKQRLIKEAGQRQFEEGEKQRRQQRRKEEQKEKLQQLTEDIREKRMKPLLLGRLQKNIQKTIEAEERSARTQQIISQSVREKGFVSTARELIQERKPAGIVLAGFETIGVGIEKLSSKITRSDLTYSQKIRVQQTVGRTLLVGSVLPLFKTTAVVERTVAKQQTALIAGTRQPISDKFSRVKVGIKTEAGRIGTGVARVESKTVGPITVSKVKLAGQVGKKPPSLAFPTGTPTTGGVQKFIARSVSVSVRKGERLFFQKTIGVIKEGRKVTPFVGRGAGIQFPKSALGVGATERITGPSTRFVSIIRDIPKAVPKPIDIEILPRSLFIGPPRIPVPKSAVPSLKPVVTFTKTAPVTPTAQVQTLKTVQISSVQTGVPSTIASAITPQITQAPVAIVAPSTVPTQKSVQTDSQKISQAVTTTPSQKVRTITKQVPAVVPSQAVRPIQTQIVRPIQTQIPSQQITQATRAVLKIPVPTVQKTTIPRSPVINIPLPRPTTPPPPPPPPPRLRVPSTFPRIPRTFGVEVRRRGKFRPIAKGLSLQKAITVGAVRVGGNISATFRVTPEQRGTIPSQVRTPRGFKKKKGLVFVEQPKFRLDMPKEISQIQSARIKI